jgi:type II secretory pathway component PulC
MAGNPGAIVTWLAVSAGLTGVVALEMSESVPLAPTVTAATVDTAAPAPVDVDLATVSALSPDALDDIMARPLFAASRRPFEPTVDEQPVAVSAPDQPLSLQLVGTMLSPSSSMVLLKHPSKGLLRLRQGQVVEGWKIGEIGNNRVELRRAGEVEQLRLRTDLLPPGRDGRNTGNAPRPGRSAAEEAAAAPVREETGDQMQPPDR